MEIKVPMTRRGFEKLEAEMTKLKSEERPEVIKAIAEARALGDLSENAEYHAAKERQGFIEGRIAELEGKISHAEIIETTSMSGSTVKFGATVTLIDEDTEEESTYQVVGADEADINTGLLSYTAPLAKALIGKEADDLIEVTTPNGSKEYSIIKIAYK